MDNDNNFLKISFVLENVKFNITTINYLKEHFKKLLSDNIIFSNKYDDIINKLKYLNLESNSQLKSLLMIERIFLLNEIDDNLIDIDDDEILNKITTVKSNSNTIYDEIKKMVQESGYVSIHESLNIIDRTLYEKHKINLFYKIDVLEKFFQPIKLKKNINKFKENINVKIKNIPIEPNKKLPTLPKNIKNNFDKYEIENDNLKINLIYELNKAIIEIEIEDNLYIIEGYFKEDTFNELYLIDIFEFKYKNIKKKLLNSKKIMIKIN